MNELEIRQRLLLELAKEARTEELKALDEWGSLPWWRCRRRAYLAQREEQMRERADELFARAVALGTKGER